MTSCAELSTEQLKAYLYLTGKISYSTVDNQTTHYIQHYGLNHVNESLGTFNPISDEIETRFPDSQILEKLKEIGLTPNATSDYIGMFSAFRESDNPKYQNRTLDLDKARELSLDREFMGNKAYLDRINEDKRNGIRYVTGDDEDPSYGPDNMGANKNESQLLSKKSYDCCDVFDCDDDTQCRYMSTSSRKCSCHTDRLGDNCNWDSYILQPHIGVIQIWHCKH